MDLSIIREVFEHCLRGADMLGCRGELHRRIERSLVRLYPFKVGRHGQLQEWCFDFAESMPGMGHVSHMYGLFPGELFTPQRNLNLYEACRESMFRRFAHGAFKWGWPAAWSVSLFARLKERAGRPDGKRELSEPRCQPHDGAAPTVGLRLRPWCRHRRNAPPES
jgi:alpha-L-fucosidase 2